MMKCCTDLGLPEHYILLVNTDGYKVEGKMQPFSSLQSQLSILHFRDYKLVASSDNKVHISGIAMLGQMEEMTLITHRNCCRRRLAVMQCSKAHSVSDWAHSDWSHFVNQGGHYPGTWSVKC